MPAHPLRHNLPVSPTPAPDAPPLPPRAARIALFLLRCVGYLLVVALVISLLTGDGLWHTVVHTLSIGGLCWLFVDSGRVAVARWRHRGQAADSPQARSRWPGWGWMLAVLLVGTLLGSSLGNALGNALNGTRLPGFLEGDAGRGFALLVLSLLPGLGLTYRFYSLGRIAATEALARQAQRQAAENQLRLLESQLEPHMLFNTLANLRVLIGIDPARAQQMLDRLIGFLRATLGASRVGMHPLSAEFARLADYLALMQIRMGERLRTTLELPAELASTPVPPLLLQPLVENAIQHGLEPHVDGGRLIVRARLDGDRLVLTVRDTGAGLAAAPAAGGTHFGLQQVRERLATLYGERGSLTLAAADDADGGTVATVRIPIAHATR